MIKWHGCTTDYICQEHFIYGNIFLVKLLELNFSEITFPAYKLIIMFEVQDILCPSYAPNETSKRMFDI